MAEFVAWEKPRKMKRRFHAEMFTDPFTKRLRFIFGIIERRNDEIRDLQENPLLFHDFQSLENGFQSGVAYIAVEIIIEGLQIHVRRVDIFTNALQWLRIKVSGRYENVFKTGSGRGFAAIKGVFVRNKWFGVRVGDRGRSPFKGQIRYGPRRKSWAG